MVSDIEDGLGLEFISLRIPTSKKNDFFEGHIFTLDGYGEPVNARCGVLSLDKFNEIIDKSVQKEFSLDFSLGHTKQSVDNVALIGTKTLTELKGQSKLIELIERMAMHERVQNEKNLVPQ